MAVGRRERRWRWAAVLTAALAASAIESRPASAGEDQAGKPWFPLVEEGASPDSVYESNALSVVHGGDTGWRVNRGKYRAGVTRADFFVTIGRADLASQERSSESLRSTLIWGGAAVALVGAMVLYAAVSRGGFDPRPPWGLGIMAGGGVMIVIGSSVHGPSLSAEEVDEMVGRYNTGLKSHIEEETGTMKPRPTQARVDFIAPFLAGQSGAGLLAVAHF